MVLTLSNPACVVTKSNALNRSESAPSSSAGGASAEKAVKPTMSRNKTDTSSCKAARGRVFYACCWEKNAVAAYSGFQFVNDVFGQRAAQQQLCQLVLSHGQRNDTSKFEFRLNLCFNSSTTSQPFVQTSLVWPTIQALRVDWATVCEAHDR